MKLKITAEPRDWLIFGIFALFLLFLVCLGVLNLSSLALTGSFHGINPFPAFGPKYIAATFVFYIIALVALIASCKSYFFDTEEGFGISATQKAKGYSRWAREGEMKAELKKVIPSEPNSEFAGVPIINNGRELWVDDGEYHTLVIGATGSGKTQATVFPQAKTLMKHEESMIITDPKGEIYEEIGEELKSRGYNIILLNFRNPQKGNAWNPMTLPYNLYKNGNQDKAIELLDDLALNILYDESNTNADPFWEKTSADYFSGLALAMFEDASEDKININSISLSTTVGEEKFGGSNYAKEYFSAKDPTSAAYINASSTILAPNETRGSIIAVFKQKIKLFASRENLSEMLSHSDFDMADIGRKKSAVFIIVQDEKKTYHSLATIFIKQCYETLIDVAQESGGKLPTRTNFILDEFANMPPLKDVTTMITAARSRQIRFTMIIQNFAQLNQVYGKENAETIKGNCGNIIYLISSELAALEEISKLAGEQKSKTDDKTASTPLVTVSDLQRMKQYDQVVLRMRMQPFKTHVTPNWKMDWGNKFPKAGYPERPKQEVHVFDMREFVKEQKKQKLMEMMNQADSGTSNGGMVNNPFAPSGPMRADMPNPFAGGAPNPFAPREDRGAMPNPFAPREERGAMPNPFAPPKEERDSQLPVNDPPKDFDVDALVRKIDAKIAELEEEEKREKENRDKAKDIKAPDESVPSRKESLEAKTEDQINNNTIEEKVEDISPIPSSPEDFKQKITDIVANQDKDERIEEKIEESNNVNKVEHLEENKEDIKVNDDIIIEDNDDHDDNFFDDFFDDDDDWN